MAALGHFSSSPPTMRRDLPTSPPSLDDAPHIVGPLLIANALMWALWGVLCFQLYLFAIAAARERSKRKGKFSVDDSLLASSLQQAAKRKEDVNPWTLDVIDRASPPPPPLSINTQAHRSHLHATNRHYDLRLSDISYDPYAYHSSAITSPITTDETHGDRDRRLHKASSGGDISQFPTPSVIALQNGPKKLSTIFSMSSPRAQSIASSACALASVQAHSTILTLFMLRSTFVRLTAITLFLVVSVQVFVGTAYIWQVLVHGWAAFGSQGRVVGGDQRLLAVSTHILGVIAFLLSMAFFAYRILLLPALVALKANKINTGSDFFGTGSGKGGKLLRPLSLVLKRDTDSPRQRHGVGNGGPGLGGLYAGGGHVQPIPSVWQKMWVKVKAACGRFRTWYSGVFPSVRRDMAVQMNLGTRDKAYAYLGLSCIGVAVLLVILVSVCGIIVGAQAIRDPDALGSPMDFTGESAIWRAGEVVLNACVCCLLLGSLLRAREHRIPYPSFAIVIVRVLVESGIALLLVAIVALGFTSTMTDGRNTIPSVPGLILPVLYANTVLLNATQSSAFLAHCTFLTQAEHSSTTETVGKSSPNPLGSVKGKDAKDISHAGDIEMGIRGIASTEVPGQQQFVRLSRAENSDSSTNSNGSSPSGNRAGGAGKERDQTTQSQAGMHMERDTFGETSTGLKHTTSIKSLRNDVVSPTITPGGIKPYNRALNPRRLSAVSQDGLSLDLPVFRKGRRQYYNDYYNGAWDGYDDDYDEDEDDESYMSSEDGGTWDYGYALNMANAERDRERDERERATQLAATEAPNSSTAVATAGQQTVANDTMESTTISQPNARWQQQQQQQHSSLQVPYHTSPLRLQRKSFPSSPLSPHRRHSSLRHASSRDNGVDDASMSDAKSMRSMGSRTSRRSRHGRPFSNGYRHPLHTHHYSHLYDEPIPSSSSNVGMSPPPVPTSHGRPPRRLPPTPYDNNVLVISPDREPSIAELSLFKAASVAATRASTGSQWSSYTYPKPMAFPELDEDLQPSSGTGSYMYQTAEEGGTSTGLDGGMTFSSDLDNEDVQEEGEWEEGAISFAEYDPDATESMREASLMEQDIGDALYSFAGMGHTTRMGDSSGPATTSRKQRQSSYHPYASAALDADEQVAEARARRMREEDSGRRRWRVHPLIKMVEMGRFKR